MRACEEIAAKTVPTMESASVPSLPCVYSLELRMFRPQSTTIVAF
jgi:hypothetical protein